MFVARSPFSRDGDDIRIVSEMPNIAENFALRRRIKRFRIFGVWGASWVYPPEDSELCVIRANSEDDVRSLCLEPVELLMEASPVLIVNRKSLSEKDLSPVISPLLSSDAHGGAEAFPCEEFEMEEALLSIALPDGHQEKHCSLFLKERGLILDGYPGKRRPKLALSGVRAKVIRPQDMPFQVACSNFDLAITGRDWLMDHLNLFPNSPVEELLDLGFGRVRIVSAVHEKFEPQSPVRIVSEYVNIADSYGRRNHLRYKVIPSWGATEAFLPEDGDILIENVETGTTLKLHNLKIKEVLFESSAVLIANKNSLKDVKKAERIERILQILRGR